MFSNSCMRFHRSIEMFFVHRIDTGPVLCSKIPLSACMCRSVSQAFSDPSQAPLSRLKQQAQGEIGKIRVRSTATGFVGKEGLGCEARPLDLFKSSQDTTRASWELRGTPGDEAEKKQRCLLPYTDPYTYIYIYMYVFEASFRSQTKPSQRLSFYRFKIVYFLCFSPRWSVNARRKKQQQLQLLNPINS